MDKTVIAIIIAIVLVAGLFFVFQSGVFTKIPSSVQPAPLPAGIVLFYGQGCPHCADVDAFIKANNIEQKVQFARMEVWYNKSNQLTLGQVAQKCNISLNNVGVPLVYDPSTSSGQAGKCYEGETDVMNFFKNAAGIK
jgi:hypothetical protein